MISKRSTFVATAYASRISQPFMYPRNALSLGTVQAQMFSNPSEGYEINDVLVSALDRMQMPHADHDWCVVHRRCVWPFACRRIYSRMGVERAGGESVRLRTLRYKRGPRSSNARCDHFGGVYGNGNTNVSTPSFTDNVSIKPSRASVTRRWAQ